MTFFTEPYKYAWYKIKLLPHFPITSLQSFFFIEYKDTWIALQIYWIINSSIQTKNASNCRNKIFLNIGTFLSPC